MLDYRIAAVTRTKSVGNDIAAPKYIDLPPAEILRAVSLGSANALVLLCRKADANALPKQESHVRQPWAATGKRFDLPAPEEFTVEVTFSGITEDDSF